MDVRIAQTQNQYSGCDTKQNTDPQKGDEFFNVLSQLSEQAETLESVQEKEKLDSELDESVLEMAGLYNHIPLQLTDVRQLKLGDTLQSEMVTEQELQNLFVPHGEVTQNFNASTSTQVVSAESQQQLSVMFDDVLEQPVTLNETHTSLMGTKSLIQQRLKTSFGLEPDIQGELELTNESGLEASLKVDQTINSLQTMRTVLPHRYGTKDEEHKSTVTELNLENNQELTEGTKANQMMTSFTPTVQSVQIQEIKSETVTTIKWENQFETMDELVKTAQTLHQDEVKTIVLKLYPRNLGNVNVVLSMKDGMLSAKMTLERPEVKEMMEKSLQQLAAQFERNNVKVQSFEVNVQSNTESFEQQKDNESNRSKKERASKEQSKNQDNTSVQSIKELISQLI